jgi:hypothetical protein
VTGTFFFAAWFYAIQFVHLTVRTEGMGWPENKHHQIFAGT